LGNLPALLSETSVGDQNLNFIVLVHEMSVLGKLIFFGEQWSKAAPVSHASSSKPVSSPVWKSGQVYVLK
jgi:hypothetical protein